jgi:RND family efflux transporter MFP subunit
MNKIKNWVKKRKITTIILIIIILVGGYYWYKKAHSSGAQVQYVTAAAEKGTLTTSVSASGSVIVDQSASVDPTINGTVANLSVKVGDQVKKGQLLFNIVNDQLGVSLDQAQASYTQAQGSLQSSQAGVYSANSTYYSDKRSGSTAGDNQKEADKKKVSAAKTALDASQQSLTASGASLAYAQEEAGKRDVTSPIDGTVNQVNVANGDDLGASSSTHVAPIIIGDLGTLEAQVQVNEVDVTNVTIGQKATVTFDAIPNFTATGKVTKMDSLGTTTQGVVTYNVTIAFDSLDPRIKPDMTVTAEIVTNVEQDVITVPMSAVKTQSGSSYVQVLNSGAVPTQVPVQVGDSNGTDTVITSGVNAGDNVVTQTINPNATVNSATNAASNRGGGGFGGGGFGGAARVVTGGGAGRGN